VVEPAVTVSRPVSGRVLVPVLYAGTMRQFADLAGQTTLTTTRRFSAFLDELRTFEDRSRSDRASRRSGNRWIHLTDVAIVGRDSHEAPRLGESGSADDRYELKLAIRSAMPRETSQQITRRRNELAELRAAFGVTDSSQFDGRLDHQRVVDFGGCPECSARRGTRCKSRRGYRLSIEHQHEARWVRAGKAQRRKWQRNKQNERTETC